MFLEDISTLAQAKLNSANAGLDSADGMLKTKSMRKKWRDGFPGTSLDSAKWDSDAGAGGSITVSGGTLTLNSGTTANDTVFALAKETFLAPVRLLIGLTLSQRIANQSFLVEFVSVDSTTGIPDGLNSVAWLFDGTSATLGKYRTQIAGNAAIDSAASTISTTASAGLYEIELSSDNAWYHAGTLDSNLIRANSYRRHTGTPDPSATYKLRFRWLNGSSAPASSTAATISYVIVQDHEVITTEVIGGRGQTAAGQEVGVGIIGTVSITGNLNSCNTVASANVGIPGLIADVASAALTTTTTTASITPTYGCSYSVSVPVTAVSGTNPTLDIVVQESDDTGTNWFDVYHFQRITTTGTYRSPKIPLTGNRVRYVQTIGGTTPSFTRSINRLQSSDAVMRPIRQLIDRSTISLTTLSSATPSLNTQGCNHAQLIVNMGAASAAPVLQLQASSDMGTTWYNIGTTLTAVANSTVELTISTVYTALLRAIVTTAGSTVTPGYVQIRGF